MTVKIKPIQDRIVVKRDDIKEVTESGIVLPGAAAEKPFEGTVVAVGQGKYSDKGELLPMHLKHGDKVLFGKFAGTEVKVEGEKYLVMREEDILCILT